MILINQRGYITSYSRVKESDFMRRRFLMYIALLGLLLVGLAGCGKANSESSVHKIKDRGTLVVGMISANPPYEYQVTKNGQTKEAGADVRLVKKVAAQLGVKYQIKTMDLDGLLPALQAGKVDMLITSLSPTPERKQGAKFSKIYYKSTNTLVVPKNKLTQYQNSDNFAHATIAVVNNSTQDALIKKQFPHANIKRLAKVTDLALAVNNGKADAFAMDVPTATILLRQNPNLAMTKWRHDDSSLGAAIALPKNSSQDLVQAVNKVINNNKDSYAKWVQYYAQHGDVN